MTVQTISRSLCVVCILCFASSVWSSEHTSGQMTSQSENSRIERSFSKEEANELLRQRKQQISQLLRIAQLPNVETRLTHGGLSSPQLLAIGLLGEFRSEEAVGILIERITFFVPCPSAETTPAACYPCARALVEIGLPSVKGILKRLDSPVTEQEMKLFATVVWLVDGDEIGLLRLENALKYATTKSQKNLETFVEAFRAKKWYLY